MSKVVGCIIARTTSTRLPHKILRRVLEKEVILDVLIERMKTVSCIDDIYIATSNESVDDILEDFASDHKIKIYRGSAENVISRMIEIGTLEKATHLVRITGDNVFTDQNLLDYQIKLHLEHEWEYSRIEGLPVGSTAEVINIETLIDCASRINQNESEYMMLYLYNPDLYKAGVILYDERKQLNKYSLTVDTPIDLQRTREILYYTKNKFISTEGIIDCVLKNNIQNSEMLEATFVKLPQNRLISYSEFRYDMNERLKKCQIINFNGVK
ncbi:hypothetical protein KDN24_14725 [Bacillus sp. Bva_UNVM-123]|uniref:cytidylyltransferase domain-containing protein n=1 Tax=Bacillus sp. Bva_UNVM-123 TaxID=2829798 RepID=UPI00391F923B